MPEERLKQEERRKSIEKIKIRLEDAGIGSADEILKEYREVSERDTFLEKELLDLNTSAQALLALIKELNDKLTTEFKIGVEKINAQFQEFFTKMFGGGTAKLSVIKEEKRKKKSDTDLSALIVESADASESFDETTEEGEEGIEIDVTLPKKKIKGLMMLSGGERALTSIALLFAMSQVNPPPFIILDETDAALDEANSKKYGDMIAELSKYSQLILVTHNRETMSRAGIIYGVTMGADGVSKLLSIQFDEAVQVAK
jgi:chromosome segregation protein